MVPICSRCEFLKRFSFFLKNDIEAFFSALPGLLGVWSRTWNWSSIWEPDPGSWKFWGTVRITRPEVITMQRLRGRSKWSGKCAGILDSDWTTDHNETFSLVTARSVLVTWICKLQSGWERAWDFRWVLFVWSKCDNGRGIINYLELLAKALSYFIQFAWSTF